MNKLNKYGENTYSRNNIFIIICFSIISLLYFLLIQRFIPMKFHFDSLGIKYGLLNPQLASGSYRSAANFFRFFGFSYYTPLILINIASWVMFLFTLLTILRCNKHVNFSIYQIILLSFFMLMYGFYFTNYSKDIIVLFIFILAINLPPVYHNLLINIILAILFYGFFFRSYWLIIGLISLIPLLIKHVKLKKDIIYIIITVVLFIIVYYYVTHMHITDTRVHINLERVGDSNAKSMINNLVSSSSIYTDVINYIYVLVSLFIPIQGLSSFGMIIYYMWILSLVVFCIKYRKKLNLRIILVLLIYINIQALFEPDFGSVLRHQLGWFPVLYYGLMPKFIMKSENY